MPQRLFCILPTGECKPNFHCFLETILDMKNALLATGTAAEANSEAQEAPVLFVVRICGVAQAPLIRVSQEGCCALVQGQRLKPAEWTEDDLLCNMSGHHAIALAALQVAATQSNRAAEVSAQVKMGLQSLLGDMQVWPASV